MTKPTELQRNSLAIKITDAIFLLLTGLYIFRVDASKTTLKLGFPDGYYSVLFVALAMIAVIRLIMLLVEKSNERKDLLRKILAGLVVAAMFLWLYKLHGYNNLPFCAVLTLGMIGIDYLKALKVYVVTAFIVILPAIVMSWIGAVNNLVYIRDTTIRSSWGIKYPTDMMSLLFFLTVTLWIVSRSSNVRIDKRIKNDSPLFIASGLLMLAMSLSIADSRTGAICDVAFIIAVISEKRLSQNKNNKIERYVDTAAISAFPVLTVIMIALVLAFRAELPGTAKINSAMSSRLLLSANILDEYGVHLLGNTIKMVGNGGSTFIRPNYIFLDISYIDILLRYGVITLLLVNLIWVVMSYRAKQIGDRRLLFALVLIAINAAAEHHIMQVNYDIFLVMPFVGMACRYNYGQGALSGSCEKSNANGNTKDSISGTKLVSAAFTVIFVIGVIAAFLLMLPNIRTAVTLLDIRNLQNLRRLCYALCVVLIAIVMITILAFKEPIQNRRSANQHLHSWNSIRIAAVALLAIIICGGVLVINTVIKEYKDKVTAMVESDRDAIEIIQTSGSGKLYEYGLPALYNREYKGISTSLFDGEELARYKDVSVIIDRSTDSACFFGTSFLYTDISDEHAVYTNNKQVITALRNAGYHLTAYYPELYMVDLHDEAKRNKKEQNDDGSITLGGENEKLKEGPRTDIRSGKYTFTFDLSIDKSKMYNSAMPDAPVCTLKVRSGKGKFLLAEQEVTIGDFDVDGDCNAEIVAWIPDSTNVDLRVLPAEANSVTVKGMSYQKTPEYDIHVKYDDKGRHIYEEYYDLDGNPCISSGGYFARGMEYNKDDHVVKESYFDANEIPMSIEDGYASREFEYDGEGNRVREIYCDQNGNRVLNSRGFAEIRRKYNELNQDIRDEFYDVEGKRTTLPPGQAAVCFAYDGRGRRSETSFYDIHDKPTLVGGETWGGYYKTIQTYDDNDKVTRQDFLGLDDKLVMMREGYAYRILLYDESGEFTGYKYYDIDGNEVNEVIK